MPAFVTFGRILFAVLFIYSGAATLFDLPGIAAKIDKTVLATLPALFTPYMTQMADLTGMAMPKMLAIAAGAFEVIAGLMIAVNFGARFFAILLILYVAAVTFYFYDFWNQPVPSDGKMLVEALKNLSIIGALFMVAGYGRHSQISEPAYGDV